MSYFDNAATTRMLPEALAAYVEAAGQVGNASSVHSAGRAARAIVERARRQVAESLGADPAEVIFTGGGTESINLALKGIFGARNLAGRTREKELQLQKPILLIAGGEHHATSDSAEWLAAHEGAQLEYIPLSSDGKIDLHWTEQFLAAHAPQIALVSVLLANNEVGTVQPVTELRQIMNAQQGVERIPLHVDAVAAYGQISVDFAGLGADALSVSAHKIGGAMGCGALLVVRGLDVEPLLHGGGQERKIRSGTLDTPAIASFGVAAQLIMQNMESKTAHLRRLQLQLAEGIKQIPGAEITGVDVVKTPGGRIPGNVHAVFHGCQGDSLLFLLDSAGIQVSTGSACTAGVIEPSQVLLAMGYNEDDAKSALRFTMSAENTESEVAELLRVLPGIVAKARAAGMSNSAPKRF